MGAAAGERLAGLVCQAALFVSHICFSTARTSRCLIAHAANARAVAGYGSREGAGEEMCTEAACSYNNDLERCCIEVGTFASMESDTCTCHGCADVRTELQCYADASVFLGVDFGGASEEPSMPAGCMVNPATQVGYTVAESCSSVA